MNSSLKDIEAQIADKQLPPVQEWQPEREADMDMVIRADGSWWHEGSKIQRERMVMLFSTILRLESDGRYCLVTPVEKLFIKVDDAPFIATTMTVFNVLQADATIVFETNVGDSVILDQQHTVQLVQGSNDHPRPYLHVRDGLRALLTRSVYYQLAEGCVERDGQIGIISADHFHVLDMAAGPAF